MQYATTRTNETADALLKRMGISVGPVEMVKVDVSEPEIFIEIAASFTYYETLIEPAEHATVYTESYKVPKGDTQAVSYTHLRLLPRRAGRGGISKAHRAGVLPALGPL